uniref:UBC core domain-containing protein n=1 Tax=Amphilophus citrinellus TaxID=61819 RepID=A0A3Q0SFB2_AMPCI
FKEKDKRILEELKSLHCDPHPYVNIFPSESDFTFWKILMEGPPETPYEKGVFELFCQFGPDYPVKPPTVRFVTPIYHCNINNVGRICHNIFDRNYNAQITMREILDAVFGLLINPEPEDPLDSNRQKVLTNFSVSVHLILEVRPQYVQLKHHQRHHVLSLIWTRLLCMTN